MSGRILMAAALAFAGCMPLGDPVFPGLFATNDSAPGAPLGTPNRPDSQTVLTGVASVQGQPLAQAEIAVLIPTDWLPFGATATTDEQGRFELRIPAQASAVLQLTARKGDVELYRVLEVEGLTTQGMGETLQIDVASTIVTKKILPKLTEVLISEAELASSFQRTAGLISQLDELTGQVARLIQNPPSDMRISTAIQTALANPAFANVEKLANALVTMSPLGDRFSQTVAACNQAVIDNMKEGGSVLTPQIWGVGSVVVNPPRVSVAYDNRVVIVQGNQVTTIWTSGSAVDGGRRAPEVFLTANTELKNTPYQPDGGGGGSRGPQSVFDIGIGFTEGAAYTGPASWVP